MEFTKTILMDSFESNGCKYTYADGSRTGWTLESDEEITGDVLLSGGTLNLNGFKLTINGNLTQTDGEVFINNGELVVNGDYKIQLADGGNSNGALNMTNESDTVTVSGSFVMQSTKSHVDLLTNGTITIGGDFTQKNSNYSNYYTSGNHTTILNSDSAQTVTFANPSTTYSHFNNFKMENTSVEGITFKSNVSVTGVLMNTESVFTQDKIYLAATGSIENDVWNSNLYFEQSRTLIADETINGTLYVTTGTLNLNGKNLTVENLSFSGGTIDLNGGTLTVTGDVTQTGGTMNINGGKLLVDGDYSLAYGYTSLHMLAADSYVFVGGDFTMSSRYSHNGYLKEGTLEVKGDFTQTSSAYTDTNFYATENHKVILSGEEKQIVTFASENCQFNILEISKSLENGYEFSRTPVWNELIEREFDNEAPSIPMNLQTTTVTTSAIVLIWDECADNVAISGYYVYCNGVKVADVKSTKYSHNNLKSDSIYNYYVQAYDVEQNVSERSDIIKVSTVASTDAPSAPSNLAAEITDEGIRITWSASTSSNLAGYDIYRNNTCIGSATGLSYLDKDVEPGIYVYYVRAFDDAGNLSNIRNSVTVDNDPPTTPIVLLEAVSDTSVKLVWSVSSTDVEKFEIYRNDVLLRETEENAITDTGLIASQQYEYYVIAYDRNGNASEKSEIVAFCANDTEAPEIISISPAEGNYSGEVSIIATATDNVAISNITFETSQDKTNWIEVSSSHSVVNSRKYIAACTVDTAQYENGNLYIRVIAYDKNSNSSSLTDTIIAHLSINNNKPECPDPVNAYINDGYAEVSWGYPDPDTQYFEVYRSLGDGYELIADNYKYCNYFEERMEIGVKYSYYIIAVNSYGCKSDPSDVVEIFLETDDTAPEILSVSPSNGKSIMENQQISISCRDNYMLKSLKVEIASVSSEDYTEILFEELDFYHNIVKFNLDTDDLEDGRYKLKFTAEDQYGNTNEPYIRIYNYECCKLTAPELTAVGEGWRNTLSWTINNTEETAGYIIYRKDSLSGGFYEIERTTKSTYSDGQVTAGRLYWYMVVAVDVRSNLVYSSVVKATPLDEDDIPPTAHAGIDLFTIAGREVQFNGKKSFDNRNRIDSYEWDFGDGTQGTGSTPTHVYAEEGVYTATLVVVDTSGNSHSDTVTVTVRDAAFCMMDFCVSSEGGVRLGDTMVYCEGNGFESETYTTDSKGNVTIFALPGTYDVYFCKDGYLPVHKEVFVSNDMETVSVTLEEKELITGALTVKELEYSEMMALGIDIYAPENQHVFEYSTTIEHKKDSSGNGIESLVFYVNTAGELVNSERSYQFTDSEGRTSTMFLHILTDEEFAAIESMPTVAVLTITAGFSWTKEFFDVELTIINNATEEFSIDNSYAALYLPDGLSIADSYLGTELTRNMGSIGGGTSKTASWIVRGDVAGEYELSADFTGTLMPFNKTVTATFKTEEPVIVEAGNALYLEEVRNMIEDWEHWSFTYKLTNISDKPVHGVQGSIGGDLGFGSVDDMMIVYPNGRTIMLEWNGGEPDFENAKYYFDALNYSEDDGLDTLQPGEYVMIYLTLDLELTEDEE